MIIDTEALRRVVLAELIRQGVECGSVTFRDVFDHDMQILIRMQTAAETVPKYLEAARLVNQLAVASAENVPDVDYDPPLLIPGKRTNDENSARGGLVVMSLAADGAIGALWRGNVAKLVNFCTRKLIYFAAFHGLTLKHGKKT